MSAELRRNPELTDDALNALFEAAWPNHRSRTFTPVLVRSLVYVGAFADDRLVGFVNVAWDGGVHGFILDTTVHPSHRREGMALALLAEAAHAAFELNIEWLHADFEAELEPLYRKAGYAHTEAGVLKSSDGTT
jgi:GNAT superfamily N-acetyltransferase